ncbi:MAG: GNAT family N-acetyltransferase [Gemmataceae bacterium]
MNVSIIQAGVEHVLLVAPLFDRYRQFYRQPPDPAGTAAFLRERLSRQHSVVFVAVDAAAPAVALGFVQLYPTFSSIRMKPVLILNDLYVAEEARRAGVARRLMNAALEHARATGAVRLELSTAKDNVSAKALYLDLGYEIDRDYDHLQLTVS